MQNNSIGEILRKERLKQEISLEEANYQLKIKVKYLKALEENKFEKFASDAMLKGFLDNYSKYLGIKKEVVNALYRRDYLNKNMLSHVDKSKEEEKSEKLKIKKKIKLPNIKIHRAYISTLVALIFIILVGVFTYRMVEQTLDKPELKLIAPIEISADYEGTIEYSENTVVIEGTSEDGVSIFINDLVTEKNALNEFKSDTLTVPEDENTIIVKAVNPFGNESSIVLRLNKPSRNISEMKIRVEIINEDVDLQIKTDGIIFFEAKANAGQIENFSAKENLEITTDKPENVKIFINEDEYSLTENLTNFRNIGTEIIKVKSE